MGNIMKIKILILLIIFSSTTFLAQSNLDRQAVTNLLGKTAVMDLKDGASIIGKIENIKWVNTAGKLVAVFSMVNDLGEYLTQDQIKTVRTIEVDGKSLLFDFTTGGLATILHLIDLQDLGWDYKIIRTIMQNYPRISYRKKVFSGATIINNVKYYFELELKISQYKLSGFSAKTYTYISVDNVKVIPSALNPTASIDGKIIILIKD